jgi:hypothetical protein
MADLSDLKPNKETVEVILRHPRSGEPYPNDDGSEMTITVHAPWTKAYRSAGFKHANERLRKRKGNKEDFDFTFEELEEAGIDLLVDVTIDWNITFGGEKPKFTAKKAKEVYTEIFWIKGQLEGAINEAGDFTNL